MNENNTSISQATSYQEVGEYWDKHDLAESKVAWIVKTEI